jgi:hypothetical protein
MGNKILAGLKRLQSEVKRTEFISARNKRRLEEKINNSKKNRIKRV